MVWAGGLLKTAFRPEAVADAATGVAEKAIPQAAESLELMLEDGAYDIVDGFGQHVLTGLPSYRESLVSDLIEAKAQISAVLAEQVVQEFLSLDVSLLAAAENPVNRGRILDEILMGLDRNLAASMMTESRQSELKLSLETAALSHSALQQMALGRQPNHDREILLSWLSVIAQSTEK